MIHNKPELSGIDFGIMSHGGKNMAEKTGLWKRQARLYIIKTLTVNRFFKNAEQNGGLILLDYDRFLLKRRNFTHVISSVV